MAFNAHLRPSLASVARTSSSSVQLVHATSLSDVIVGSTLLTSASVFFVRICESVNAREAHATTASRNDLHEWACDDPRDVAVQIENNPRTQKCPTDGFKRHVALQWQHIGPSE